eukprot:5255922-Prymnesium_polylepis.1
MLSRRSVRLVCPQQLLQERLGHDKYMISLVEQEMCARANAFIGSKYSTWTDTVKGLRAYRHGDTPGGPENFVFEELYALGVRRRQSVTRGLPEGKLGERLHSVATRAAARACDAVGGSPRATGRADERERRAL